MCSTYYHFHCFRRSICSNFLAQIRWMRQWLLARNLMRIQIRLIILMRILIFIWCASGSRVLFDADSDPTFHLDPDPDPSFEINAQTLEKVLKKVHIPNILDCLLQIDADPDPGYHFDSDPGSWFLFDARPDPDFYLMGIRILIFIWFGSGSGFPKCCGSTTLAGTRQIFVQRKREGKAAKLLIITVL